MAAQQPIPDFLSDNPEETKDLKTLALSPEVSGKVDGTTSDTTSGNSNNGYTMQVVDVSLPVTTSFAPNALFNEQLHPMLIRIVVDNVQQWKIYRDGIGFYTMHNQHAPHFPTEHIINVK
jgi:hypothetical protein